MPNSSQWGEQITRVHASLVIRHARITFSDALCGHVFRHRSYCLFIMLTPTPLRSFVGGLGLPLPMHALVVLNGSVFGISGFLHRTVRGDLEAFAGVAGLVVGGLITGLLDGPPTARYNPGTLQLLLSGFLVGLGSKVNPLHYA